MPWIKNLLHMYKLVIILILNIHQPGKFKIYMQHSIAIVRNVNTKVFNACTVNALIILIII